MKLALRFRHVVLSPEARQKILDRVASALARISPWIRSVDVTVTDVNGPKGGADKQCRLRIRGRSIPGVVIEHVGADTLATISIAAERAEQVVVRKMARRRTFAPQFAF